MSIWRVRIKLGNGQTDTGRTKADLASLSKSYPRFILLEIGSKCFTLT